MSLTQAHRIEQVPHHSRGGPCAPVAHRGWQEAVRRALDAVAAGTELVLVTGRAGTGKTMLLRELQALLRHEVRDVRLEPRGDVLEGVSPPLPGGALLIDEADRLDPALLPSLLQGGGTLVLAVLKLPAVETLPGLPTVLELRHLDADEVVPFLAARLDQVGLPLDLFSAEAVSRLASSSERVPRLLARLADASLWLAGLEGAGSVGPEHVEAAARGHLFSSPPMTPETIAPVSAEALPTASPALAPEPATQLPPVRSPGVVHPASPQPDQDRASTLTCGATPQWVRRLQLRTAAACAIALLGVLVWSFMRTGPILPSPDAPGILEATTPLGS